MKIKTLIRRLAVIGILGLGCFAVAARVMIRPPAPSPEMAIIEYPIDLSVLTR